MFSPAISTTKVNFGNSSSGPTKIINGYKYKNPIPNELISLYKKAIHQNGELYFEYAEYFQETVGSPNYTADNFLKFFKQ